MPSFDQRALRHRFPRLYRVRRGASRRAGHLSTRTIALALVSTVGFAGAFALFLWQARIEHMLMGGY